LRERVQFAHMKFCTEVQGVNSGTLKIGGQRVKFTPSVGKVPVGEPRNNNSASLDSDFEAVQLDRGVAKRVVRLVEAVQDPWMRRAVKAAGAQEELEGAQRLRDLVQQGVDQRSAFAVGRKRGSSIWPGCGTVRRFPRGFVVP